jgi:hypothetical protein
MIPIRDENPTRKTPVVTYLFILVNVIVFIFQTLFGSQDTTTAYEFALVPNRFINNPSMGNVLNIFSSMFMHAGLAHIGGNMLYLWIFGDNVEDAMGKGRYFIFYILGGITASLTHILTNPSSQIPTVGASGAIAAVLGAYLILYPRQRVVTIIPLGFFMRITMLPASIVLGMWFVLQFFQGVMTLGGPDVGGVAFWAHIGGFVAGVILANLFEQPNYKNSRQTW